MTTRRTLLLGMGAAGLTLSACGGPGRGRPGMGARDPNSFSRGIELKRDGDYDEAIRYFAQVAGMGAGYEVAQYHLGDCFLQQANLESDPAKARQKAREGAFWISLAAQSGEVNAQGRMARLYIDGTGVPQSAVDAGTYLLLAESNPRTDFMTADIRRGLEDIRSGLSIAEWAEAEQRATAFEHLEQTARNFPPMRMPSRPSGMRPPMGGRPPGGGGRPLGGGRPPGYLDEKPSVD